MKKKCFVFLILALLILPLISGVEIKLSKEPYYPEETLQAEITGNFVEPLLLENILIYKQGTPRSMPVINSLTKQNNIYYFYAVLPNQEGNFSIHIENAKYTESGIEKTEPIIKEFVIEKTNQSALSINPGFVKTSQDFSVKIKSLGKTQDISVLFDAQAQNFSLIEYTEKTIALFVPGKAGKYDLKINDYVIPIFIIEKIEINDSSNQDKTNQSQNNQTVQNTTINDTKVDIENKTDEEIKSMHCSEFGEECSENESCDGETKASLEGPCCVGECREKKSGGYGFWIGLLLVIIVLSLLAYLYLKGKNKKPPSSDEILKSKSDRFSKRMSGDDVVREVRGKLDSI